MIKEIQDAVCLSLVMLFIFSSLIATAFAQLGVWNAPILFQYQENSQLLLLLPLLFAVFTVKNLATVIEVQTLLPLFQDSYPGSSNEKTQLIDPSPPVTSSSTSDNLPTTLTKSKQKKRKGVELPSKDFEVRKLLFLRCQGGLLGSNSPFPFFPSIFYLFLTSSLHLPLSFPPSLYSLPLSLSLSLFPSLLPPPHRVWTMTLATISPSKSVCEASQSGLVDCTHSPHTKQLYCVSLECDALYRD